MSKKTKPKKAWELKAVRGHHKTVDRLDSPVLINKIQEIIAASIHAPLTAEQMEELRTLRAEHDDRALSFFVGEAAWSAAYDAPDNAALWEFALESARTYDIDTAAQIRAAAVIVATDRILAPDITQRVAEALS